MTVLILAAFAGRAFAAPPVTAQGRGYPWVILGDGVPLPQYNGAGAAMETHDPRALAAGDLDGDGIEELVAGFATADGGILIVYEGNADAIYPNAPEADARKRAGQFTTQPFPYVPWEYPLSSAPDFLAVGDFDNDGHRDVVVATRGGRALQLLPGDGAGAFGAARRIDIPGSVSALATGEIHRADGSPDLVIGVEDAAGGAVLVFQSPRGALSAPPAIVRLPAAPSGLALGQLDGIRSIWLSPLAPTCSCCTGSTRGTCAPVVARYPWRRASTDAACRPPSTPSHSATSQGTSALNWPSSAPMVCSDYLVHLKSSPA